MTDQRFTELFAKQLASEITPEESDELKLMIADNENYHKEYDSLSKTFSLPVAEDESIDVIFNRIETQIDASQQAIIKPILPKLRLKIWLQIAAVFAVVISAFATYRLYFNDPSRNPELTWKTTNAHAAERKRMILSDGTVVNLNVVTELRYPEKFEGNTREVYLSGEAFFDVKKDAKHPFIIHTEKAQIKVLGTTFDVKAYKNDKSTETTLIKGRVEVTLNSNDSVSFILHPNEKLLLLNETGATSRSKLTYFNTAEAKEVIETAWIDNRLTFKDNDFLSISKLFERWYDVKIEFKDTQVEKLRFTGKFHKENLSQALEALKLIEHFNYSIQNKIVYIYK